MYHKKHPLNKSYMCFVYCKFYKPYGVLSQFSVEKPGDKTLKDFLSLPSDVYPVGRLDKDSEGLLLLTNDPVFKQNVLRPGHTKWPKSYYVQIEGLVSKEAILALNSPISISLNGKKYECLPPKTTVMPDPPAIPERTPPIRYRANKPTTWLSMTIQQGKNRQIRKMCASVGFPVLRLFRFKIGQISLDDLSIGEYRTFNL